MEIPFLYQQLHLIPLLSLHGLIYFEQKEAFENVNHELLHKPSGVEIIRADAIQYLASTQAKFDLIFLDPPYKKGWISRLEPLLPGVLNEDAAIYVEAEHEVESLGDWRTVRQGKAGEVHFHLLRRETGGTSA